MTSEARERAPAEDSAECAAGLVTEAERPAAEEIDLPAGPEEETAVEEPAAGRRVRLSLPLLPVLAVLLVLLLAAGAWLWFTRPERSSVATSDYAAVLQAARSEVVDLTSFDYLTLDDDIAEAKRITTGDLRQETLDQFDASRQQLADSQAVVQTEVVDAGVTRADGARGTVLLVIQSTQKTSADEQAQVVRYRIEAELTRVDGRWLLSGLTGR